MKLLDPTLGSPSADKPAEEATFYPVSPRTGNELIQEFAAITILKNWS
jgi:hypothetical protein